jgi:hypothetical protein
MKAKKGYKQHKGDWRYQNWYRRYFENRTCKRVTKESIDIQNEALDELENNE